MSPEAAYRDGLSAARDRLARLERQSARLSAARLLLFLAAVAGAVAAVLSRGGPGVWLSGLAAAGFAFLVVRHEQVARRRERELRSVGYFERGLARLEDRWAGTGDDGGRFGDQHHLYAADLELFGPGSLFQRLSTAVTETGAATLAGWLLVPADAATVVRRQQAVAELAPNLRLRHDLAIEGGTAGGAVDSRVLRRWLERPGRTLPGWTLTAARLLALANVATIAIALAGWAPGFVILPSLGASALLATWLGARTRRILAEADRPARELRALAALVQRVGRERFDAPLLAESLGALGGRAEALGAIRRLERLVDLADARGNQLFAPVAAALLLGTQLAAGVERWLADWGVEAVRWLGAIGQLEALTSLAAARFEHPEDVFPAVEGPGAPLAAEGLAHPLLPQARAVRNDLTLGAPVRLLMVSGSNMSGKSTLLKAVGTNLVLAFAGGVVRARAWTTGQWRLGASLVLRESLLEGRSRFYAEVLRLRDIVAAAAEGPVLFLLDELLSGTNSHDRAIGARGILDGLLARGAVGLVTTHDLALTEIAAGQGAAGDNRHLEDTLVEGRLEFDYRLKPGVVRRSNALALMKAVGLEVGADPAEAGRVPGGKGSSPPGGMAG
ncbi:MAG: DNA mismatch repair protein MutS [Gemmatimonadales bacterium]